LPPSLRPDSRGGDVTWDIQSIWHDLAEAEHSLDRGGETYGERLYDSFGRAVHDFAGRTGIDEQVSRVERIKEALADSGPLAQRRIVQVLSGIDLSTIWHILIKAAEDITLYFGGSVVAGTLIGGVAGAFFGGVGAVPGGAMGATAGAKVGGWILAFLGLKSLVEGLSDALPRAATHYETGFREAWGPTHHDEHFVMADGRGSVNRAAHDIAEGHVELIAALLAALVAYLTRGEGDRGAILQEIRQSPRLGPKVADWIAANEEKLRNHPRLKPGEKPSVAMMAESEGAKGGGAKATAGRKAKTKAAEGAATETVGPATADDELKSLPQLKGMDQSAIADTLRARGYTEVPAKSGGSVWTKDLPDGDTAAVRLDPPNARSPSDFADAVEHAHKEIVPSSKVVEGNYHPKFATTLDDFCNATTCKASIHIPTGDGDAL